LVGSQEVERRFFLSFRRNGTCPDENREPESRNYKEFWTPFLVRLWRVQRGDGFVRSCQLTLLISSGTFPDGSNHQIFSIIFSPDKTSSLFNEF